MRSGVMTRTRAAASSIASGIPSSRRQIRVTAAALSSVTRKSARAWRARSSNSRPASLRKTPSTVAPASGAGSDGTRQTHSPSMPIGSRLVTRRRTPGAFSNTARPSRAHAASRCSALSIRITSSRSATNVVNAASGSSPTWGRPPKAASATTGTRDGSATGARSAHHTPSGEPARSARPASSARRVFPHPPDPVSVAKRARDTISRISASSRARPTKLEAMTGRFDGESTGRVSGGNDDASPSWHS